MTGTDVNNHPWARLQGVPGQDDTVPTSLACILGYTGHELGRSEVMPAEALNTVMGKMMVGIARELQRPAPEFVHEPMLFPGDDTTPGMSCRHDHPAGLQPRAHHLACILWLLFRGLFVFNCFKLITFQIDIHLAPFSQSNRPKRCNSSLICHYYVDYKCGRCHKRS